MDRAGGVIETREAAMFLRKPNRVVNQQADYWRLQSSCAERVNLFAAKPTLSMWKQSMPIRGFEMSTSQ